jgi:DNA-binding XRE family transcriptional regulator
MPLAINVNDKIKKLAPVQRRKIEARAAELLAEEMTLRELRRARKLTQVRMAKTLGITQDSVSRLEKRSDLLLSTLRKTV